MRYLWNRKIRIEDLPDDNEIDSVFANINENIQHGLSSPEGDKSLTLRTLAFCRRY